MILNTCSKLRGLCLARIGQLPYIGSCVGTTPSYLNWALENGLCLHKDHDRGFIQWLGEISPEYINNEVKYLSIFPNTPLDVRSAYKLWCYIIEKCPQAMEHYYEKLIIPFGHDTISNIKESEIISSVIKSCSVNAVTRIRGLLGRDDILTVFPKCTASAILKGNWKFILKLNNMQKSSHYKDMNICVCVLKKRNDAEIIKDLRNLYEDGIIISAAAIIGDWAPFDYYIKEGKSNLIDSYYISSLVRGDKLATIKKMYEAGIQFDDPEKLINFACRKGITATAIWLAITFKIKYPQNIPAISEENVIYPTKTGFEWRNLTKSNQAQLIKKYEDRLPPIGDYSEHIITVCSIKTIKFLHAKGIEFDDDAINSVTIAKDKEKIITLLALGYKITEDVLYTLTKTPTLTNWFLDMKLIKKEDLVPLIRKSSEFNMLLAKILYKHE
jgi:hypothetical protein